MQSYWVRDLSCCRHTGNLIPAVFAATTDCGNHSNKFYSDVAHASVDDHDLIFSPRRTQLKRLR
jgi:hypothetical protein